ncbi:hypothetical protein ZBT109_2518 [Zymobacter palmae]|uniref:Uncharacterized protein n=1 Tax=Zymobacter palmae TaxID=33074 RepID=A0A348HHZ6_9GAMM|nr:hypothetical protein ZBT109_2518 [Zymobacter palmae]
MALWLLVSLVRVADAEQPANAAAAHSTKVIVCSFMGVSP